MTMKGKARKKGDWVKVAAGRQGKNRENANRSSMTGINGIARDDVGSAAYRRDLAKKTGNRRGR